MVLQIENLGLIDGQSVVDEIRAWQGELSDKYIDDRIVYSVLDTVLDIIVNAETGEI